MFSKQQCLDSLTINGCSSIGRSLWTDGDYVFRLARCGVFWKIVADRVGPAPADANQGMREALRPLFLAAARSAS